MSLATPKSQIQQRLKQVDQVNLFLVSLSLLILLGTLGFRIYISQSSGLMYDEPVTLHLAKAVASGQLPFRDFYEHHSVLPWYLLSPLANISLWRLQRLLIAVAGVLALVGLYRLGTSLWGMRAGLIIVLSGAVSPLWQHQGTMIIHDSFLVAALVAALLMWWLALQRPSMLLWLLAGIFAGLVVHSKQTGFLSVLALGIGVILFTRSVKAILAFILGGLLTLIPLLILYWDQFEPLFNGLLGWNLAANSHLPPNPKLNPFFNDIFLANPILWGVGVIAAFLALRYLIQRSEPADPKPLLAVSGLIVIFVIIFNWFLSKQTFSQYYLQAIPALILLTAPVLDDFFQRPVSKWGKLGIGVGLIYLGLINPFANSLVPWTPDLQEKLNISNWVRQEIEDEAIWEPWVYYAHLAEKDFSFFYPFLSIHSVRDDPELPTIDGLDNIDLDGFISSNDIRWIIVHQPLMPGLDTYLDRKFTVGPEDWQLIRSFQVTRYASESGMQHHFWTPWWKPLIFYETVSIWLRHPGTRQGGLVGELSFQNPGAYPYIYLEVQHPGGTDLYQLDKMSSKNQDYSLNWNQTGHAFFLSEGPLQLDHHNGSGDAGSLVFTVVFSNIPSAEAQKVYQLRIPYQVESGYCLECLEGWECVNWELPSETCTPKDLVGILDLSAVAYQPVED